MLAKDNKLSKQLMDAYMVGDQDEISRIKSEIDSRFKESMPKKKTNIVRVNTILNDDSASAIDVYNFLNEILGNDWWEWEFETLERIIWIRFGVALEDINRDKIWAIKHVCNSDNAFSDWYEFNQIALSFAGCMADFEYLRSPSPGMVICAVKSLNHMRPDRESFFGNNVLKYISIVLKENGIYAPTPSLYEFIGEKMKDIISEDSTKNWSDIFKRYKEYLNNQDIKLNEDEIDIQVKRMIKAEQAALKYGAK